MAKSGDSVRVIGIDCGTAITGWSILDVSAKECALIDYGVIETHKLSPEPDRLVDLGKSLAQLISEFSPTQMAIEDLFYFRNSTTVIKVSQARGVALYEASKAGLKIYSYTPLQIKQQLTGYGRAKKAQIIYMVNKIFKLGGSLKQDDAADAIAVGYTHYLLERV